MKRREWIQKAGAAFGLAFFAKRGRAQAAPGCVLTPSQTEGPFYFDPELVRKDITEGLEGVPLTLQMQIVNANTCEPIPEAVVEIWHADHRGAYSGYSGQGPNRNIDTRGETFLRGAQIADENGAVEFQTIYPGWYPGRLTHIHFKAALEGQGEVTSQLYFPIGINEVVYILPPYNARGQNTTDPGSDGVVRSPEEQASLTLDIRKNLTDSAVTITFRALFPFLEFDANDPADDGYTGSIVVGLNV